MRIMAPHEIDGETLTRAEQESYIERWCICVSDGFVSSKIAQDIAVDSVRGIRGKKEFI